MRKQLDEEQAAVLAAVAGKTPGASGWIRANCPFCVLVTGKPDRKQTLALHVGECRYKCFRCDTFGYIDAELLGSEGVPKAFARDPEALVVPMSLPEGFIPLWGNSDRDSLALRPARKYLRKRGVSDEMIRIAKIGACLTGRYANRVVVPIEFPNGDLAGWVARTLAKESDWKYLYSEGIEKSTLVYNGAALAVITDRPVLVVEGAFDTFPYWPDAVAVLGSPGPAQRELLEAANRPVVWMLDGDAWRKGAGMALMMRLSGKRVGSLTLPPGKDPDEVDVDLVWRMAYRSLEAEL